MANQIKYQVDFDVRKEGLNNLKSSLQQLQKLKISDIMKINGSDISSAREALNSIRGDAEKVRSALEKSFNVKLNSVNIQTFNRELEKSKLSINDVYTSFSRAGASGEAAFRNLANQVLSANIQLKESHTLLDRMATTLSNTIKWNAASTIVNGLTRSVQQAWGYVKSLDTSLNDIRVVTGKSADEMANFAVKANQAAKTLGKTTTDYTKASLIFAQQGLSDKEIEERAKITLKAASVTGQSTDAVSEQLTAVWNGYKVTAEQAEVYVDRLAAVAAKSASNLQELSTGMSKVASAAAAMGVGEDQLAAQLSTIISVTRQAPESVGAALRTVYARISDIKAGIDEDGVTLGNYSGKMAELGINVLDMNGHLRDMGDVIEQIGGKWGTMTREQQVYLTQTMAGQRQYNNLLALFDNFQQYNKMLGVAQQAQGTLQKQHDTYMESTVAHLNVLKASMENIYDSLFDMDGVNGLIDGLAKAANGVADLVDSLGGGVSILKTLGAVGLMVFSQQIGNSLQTTINNFQRASQQAEYFRDKIAQAQKMQQEGAGNEYTRFLIGQQQSLLKMGSRLPKDDFNAIQEKIQQLSQNSGNIEIVEEKIQSLNNTFKILGKDFDLIAAKYDGFDNALKSANGVEEIKNALENLKTRFDPVIQKQRQMEQAFTNFFSSVKSGGATQNQLAQDFDNLKYKLQDFIGALKTATVSDGGPTIFDAIPENARKSVEQASNELKRLNFSQFGNSEQALNKIQGIFANLNQTIENEIKNINQAIASTDTGKYEELQEKLKGLQLLQRQAEQEYDVLKQKAQTSIQTKDLVALAGGIASVGTSIQQILNLGSIWKNTDLSVGQRFLKIITSLAVTLPILFSGLKKIITTTKLFTVITNQQAAAAGWGTIANIAHSKSFTLVGDAAGHAAIRIEGLNKSLMINPYVALAAVIITATTALIGFAKASEQAEQKRKQERIDEAKAAIEKEDQIQEQIKSNEELNKSLQKLDEQYKNGQISRSELKAEVEKLVQQYGLEKDAADQLTKSYDNLYGSISKRRSQALSDQKDSLKREQAERFKLIKQDEENFQSYFEDYKERGVFGDSNVNLDDIGYALMIQAASVSSNPQSKQVGKIIDKYGIFKTTTGVENADFDSALFTSLEKDYSPEDLISLYDTIGLIIKDIEKLDSFDLEVQEEKGGYYSYLSKWYKDNSEKIQLLKETTQQYNETLNAIDLSSIDNNLSEVENADDYIKQRQKIIDELIKQDRYKDNLQAAENAADSYLQSYFSNLYVRFNEYVVSIKELEKEFGEDTQNIKEDLTAMSQEQFARLSGFLAVDREKIKSWDDLAIAIEKNKNLMSSSQDVDSLKQYLNFKENVGNILQQQFDARQYTDTFIARNYRELSDKYEIYSKTLKDIKEKIVDDAEDIPDQIYESISQLDDAHLEKLNEYIELNPITLQNWDTLKTTLEYIAGLDLSKKKKKEQQVKPPEHFLKQASDQYNAYQKVIDAVQSGKTIAEDAYADLDEKAKTYFDYMADGTYKMTGDAKEFYDYIKKQQMQEYLNKLKDLYAQQALLEKIEKERQEKQYKQDNLQKLGRQTILKKQSQPIAENIIDATARNDINIGASYQKAGRPVPRVFKTGGISFQDDNKTGSSDIGEQLSYEEIYNLVKEFFINEENKEKYSNQEEIKNALQTAGQAYGGLNWTQIADMMESGLFQGYDTQKEIILKTLADAINNIKDKEAETELNVNDVEIISDKIDSKIDSVEANGDGTDLTVTIVLKQNQQQQNNLEQNELPEDVYEPYKNLNNISSQVDLDKFKGKSYKELEEVPFQNLYKYVEKIFSNDKYNEILSNELLNKNFKELADTGFGINDLKNSFETMDFSNPENQKAIRYLVGVLNNADAIEKSEQLKQQALKAAEKSDEDKKGFLDTLKDIGNGILETLNKPISGKKSQPKQSSTPARVDITGQSNFNRNKTFLNKSVVTGEEIEQKQPSTAPAVDMTGGSHFDRNKTFLNESVVTGAKIESKNSEQIIINAQDLNLTTPTPFSNLYSFLPGIATKKENTEIFKPSISIDSSSQSKITAPNLQDRLQDSDINKSKNTISSDLANNLIQFATKNVSDLIQFATKNIENNLLQQQPSETTPIQQKTTPIQQKTSTQPSASTPQESKDITDPEQINAYKEKYEEIKAFSDQLPEDLKQKLDVLDTIFSGEVTTLAASAQEAIDKIYTEIETGSVVTSEQLQKDIETLVNTFFSGAQSMEQLKQRFETAMQMDDLFQNQEERLAFIDEYRKKAAELMESLQFKDLDPKDLEDYAEYLQLMAKQSDELDDRLEDDDKAAMHLAKTLMHMSSGVEKISKNWKNWSNILNNENKLSIENAKALAGMQDAVADLLDTSQDYVSKDFIKNHLKQIEDVANGSQGAVERLRDAFLEDIVANIIVENNLDQTIPDFQSRVSELQSLLDQEPIGVSIDDGAFIDALNELIIAAGLSADQVNSLLNGMHVDAVFAKTEQPVQQTVSEMSFTPMVEPVASIPGPLQFFGEQQVPLYGVTYLASSTPKTIDGTMSVGAIGTEQNPPQIESIIRKPSGGGPSVPSSNSSKGGSPKKGGGGPKGSKGSGAKKTKKDKKDKMEDDRDIYHDINIQIQKINKNLDRTQKKQQRLFGRDLLNNLEKQKQLLYEQRKAMQQKLNIQNQDIKSQRKKLKSLGVEFDKYGQISNYLDILEEKQAKVNTLTDYYNKNRNKLSEKQLEKLEKQIEKAKKDYDETKKKMDEYDKTREAKEDLKDSIEESVQKEIEINIKRFRFELELNLDMNDLKRQWNDFNRNIVQRDDIIKDTNFDKILKDIGKNNKDILTYVGQNGSANALAQHIKRTIPEIDRLLTYEGSKGTAIEDFKKDLEELVSQLGSVQDAIEAIDQAYLDTIDDAADQFDKQKQNFGFIQEILQHDMDLLTLLYGDKNYDAMNNYYNALNENSNKQIDFLKQQAALWRQKWQEAIDAGEVNAAQKFKQYYETAISDLNSTIEEAAKTLQDQYVNAIEGVFDALDKRITNGKGTDYIDMEWNLMKMNEDEYLDEINSAFAIQDLERKFNKAINNTQGIKGQQALNKLMDQQLENLKEKDKLTQYDVERAEKLLSIEQARIALEDAQAAKTSMRLKRDSQVNYSYEYVADSDDILQAQQALAKAQNDLYNFDKENYQSNLRDMLEAYKDFQNEYIRIKTDTSLKEDEKNRQLADLQVEYNRYVNGKIDENLEIRKNLYQSAIDDLKQLYQEDQTNYDQMSDEQKNSLMEQLVPAWKSGIQEMNDIILGQGGFIPACSAAFDAADQATDAYKQKVDELAESAGEDFGKVQSGVSKLAQEMQKLLTSTANEEFITKLGNQITEIEKLRLAIAGSREELQKWIGQLEKVANVSFEVLIKEHAKNGGDAIGYDTGGYTGEWSNDAGKLAFLHQKEIVLNASDTQNLLDAVDMLRQMTSSLNSSMLLRMNNLNNGFNNLYGNKNNNELQQDVHIDVTFPNVNSKQEIEEAFNEIINMAAQKAMNRF